MLIIFDLDDTLIDTTYSITEVKLKNFFKKMLDLGFPSQEPEKELNRLLEINKKAKSTKEALKIFLRLYQVYDKFFNLAIKYIYNEFDVNLKVLERKNANKILNKLRDKHQLALVSMGEEKFQLLKLRNAGIDSSLFSMIEIVQNENKKRFYKKIIDKLQQNSQQTIICGDKIDKDLIPAKELSCITVHMKYGRGENIINEEKVFVDFEIKELDELINIIQTLV